MFHLRGTYKQYKKHRDATTSCPFCDPAEIGYRTIEKTKHACIVTNKTSYDVWEYHRVEEHLMILPARHVESMSELADAELLEVSRLMGKYEDAGFSVYVRGRGSPRRSIKHVHIHLIRIAQQQPRATLYIERPYTLINF